MIATPRLLWAMVALAVLGVLASVVSSMEGTWMPAALLIAAVAVIDGIAVWKKPELKVERTVPGSLPVGVWHEVRLRIHNLKRQKLRVEVFDHYPVQMDVEDLPLAADLPVGSWVDLGYRIRPMRRGREWFARVDIRWESALGLWQRKGVYGSSSEVHIYPNFAAVSQYALLATDNRLSQIGIRKRPRRGLGMDFHQLREWREGDSTNQVDWQATSRTRKLISREYQDERDQEVVFLVDCGRRMLAKDGELSHFDHTLNAVLLLSYVALRQGDGVGVSTFSGEQRWLAPVKGSGLINRLLNGLFDLHPSTENPDYAKAATELLIRQRKRALVVILTNLRDEDAGDLMPALEVLRRRHLVVLASLREKALEEASEQTVTGFESALELASADEYLARRDASLKRIQAQGVHCLDVTPEKLPVSLVNRYLDLKASGRT